MVGQERSTSFWDKKTTQGWLQADAAGGRNEGAEGSPPTGSEWKTVLRAPGAKSTAQASFLALICHGKGSALIAAGVRTNPFN